MCPVRAMRNSFCSRVLIAIVINVIAATSCGRVMGPMRCGRPGNLNFPFQLQIKFYRLS
jgi:hypothetical protein